jgi:hypothetical protein
MRKPTVETYSIAQMNFIQSTRLFDGPKKKYTPKRGRAKTKVIVENKIPAFDLEKHERELRQFYQSVNWGNTFQKQNFFTCPYCTNGYDFWSSHEKICKQYQNIYKF